MSSGFNHIVLPEKFGEVRELVESEFQVLQGYVNFGVPTFIIAQGATKIPFRNLVEKMNVKGYIPKLKKMNDALIIGVIKKPVIKPSRWEYNLLLFLATVISVSFSGYSASINPVLIELQGGSNVLIQTIIFVAAVFAIIGLHELGHLTASLLRGKEVTFPYFIPGFPPLGTFGAIIRLKEPLINKDEMFDIGSSGPIVGFIVTFIIAMIGLQEGFSFTVSLSHLESLTAKYPGSIGGITFLPLLVQGLLSFKTVPPGHILILGPLAFTATIGAFITFLNLLPASQLDGGWISLSVLGEKWHRILSWASVLVLFLLGYWFMALLIYFMIRSRSVRAAPLDEVSPLSTSRKGLAVLCLAIFILCITIL